MSLIDAAAFLAERETQGISLCFSQLRAKNDEARTALPTPFRASDHAACVRGYNG